MRHSLSLFSSSIIPAAASNVWCVGRNFTEHIKELGNVTSSSSSSHLHDAMMIFLKAGSSIVPAPSPIPLPAWSHDVHHEIELAIQLGHSDKTHQLIPVCAAVSLDLTARDVQAQLKKSQWPWTLAKSFKGSTPMGSSFSLMDKPNIDLQALTLKLLVNGKLRQLGSTKDMIHPIDSIIDYVQSRFPVLPGDWILTGTPHGVSRLEVGDEVFAQVMSPEGLVLSEGRWKAIQG